MTNIEIHGMYRVKAPNPCALIELSIHGKSADNFLLQTECTVLVNGASTNQAPFGEYFLSINGDTILGDETYSVGNDNIWNNDIRLAFFMFYVKPGDTLTTPYGKFSLPEYVKKPSRLKGLVYSSPY